MSLLERETIVMLDICQAFTVNSSMIMSSPGKRHSIGSSGIKAFIVKSPTGNYILTVAISIVGAITLHYNAR